MQGGSPGVIEQPAAARAVASGPKFPGMAITTAFILNCAFLTKVGSSQASPLHFRGEGMWWNRAPDPFRISGEEETWILMEKEPVLSPTLCSSIPPTQHWVHRLGQELGLGGNKPPERHLGPQQPLYKPLLSAWPDGVSPERG